MLKLCCWEHFRMRSSVPSIISAMAESLRVTEDAFTQEDVEFLSQAAGQIAIAIENALAYREISELKAKLAQEKL